MAPEGFPGGTSGKELACQYRKHKRCRYNPWVGRSPGGGHGNLLQYCWLENPMDKGAWWATVHGVAQSRTRLKQFSTHAWWHWMPWSWFFLNVELQATFLLSSFTLIKRLFSSSSLSAFRVVLNIWVCGYFSQESWLQLVIHPARHLAWYTLHKLTSLVA